eukprot:6179151-Pleurochrysis_carterae.AAC.1
MRNKNGRIEKFSDDRRKAICCVPLDVITKVELRSSSLCQIKYLARTTILLPRHCDSHTALPDMTQETS